MRVVNEIASPLVPAPDGPDGSEAAPPLAAPEPPASGTNPVVLPAVHTATFLFTDIEGSTRLWEEQHEAMGRALELHDRLLRGAVDRSGGTVVKTTGDGMIAAFERPAAALLAAIDAQRALDQHAWPLPEPLRVRMAIHSGSAETRDGDFFGPALNRAARLLAIGHGRQVLVSGSTAALVADDLPEASELVDRGEHLLRDLGRPEHVYQLVAAGLQREFPSLRSVAQHESNLPRQATSFVGRERELAEVAALLESARLVALVGVGGTGKTRLALQAAADRLERQRDGAWLVELAPLSDPDLVVQAIGRSLRIQEQPAQPLIDTVLDFLRAKDLLLILDNCEHLIGAAADLSERLLAGCPDLRVVATSREPLGVAGETVFAVPSLALPAVPDAAAGPPTLDDGELAAIARAEAVRLFVERAAATLPSFTLDATNARAVVEICRRLDGIPLALELAAARINVLSAVEIAQGLGDRFRLLTGGRRTAVPRQRTLQALVDWSWDLLDDADRRLLRRLSVFAGGWTLEAAVAIAADLPAGGVGAESVAGAGGRLAVLDGLGRLADRSLVVVDHGPATRYHMLETIRQYAGDQLSNSGETAELRDRHLAYFRSLALESGRELEGPKMAVWLVRLDAEVDNVRAALDWAFETHPEDALRMCAALVQYWRSRAIASEGLERMHQAVELGRRWRTTPSGIPDPDRAALVARVMANAAQLEATRTGQGGTPELAAEAAAMVAESGDRVAMAEVAVAMSFAGVAVDGSIPTDGPIGEKAQVAVRLAEEMGDWYRASLIQSGFAMYADARQPGTGRPWLDRAAESAARSGNPFAIANVAQARGRAASMAGDMVEARRWFEDAVARFRSIGDRLFVLVIESELTHALRRDGALDEAEERYRRTIREWQRGGNRGAIAHQLESFAFIAVARGNGIRASRLLGAAEALRETAGAPMTEMERREWETQVRRLRQGVESSALAEAWAGGRPMTADEAVAFALAD
jgi:predicted ATPase/class 3 adenylate cyclase